MMRIGRWEVIRWTGRLEASSSSNPEFGIVTGATR